MDDKYKNALGLPAFVNEISKTNTDKVVHQDLKECDFDDVVMSVINPDSSKLIRSIQDNSQYLTQHSEFELTDLAKPCMVDQLLRVSFWEEVTTAQAEGRVVSENAIWRGVCANSYWFRVRDTMPYKMAYVLMPLLSYSRSNKLAMHLGQRAIIDILSASPLKDGKLDFKIAKLQADIAERIKDRVYGKSVQRIQTHNTNESIQGGTTVEELQQEIAQLEGKIAPSLPPTVVNVEIVDE